MLPLLRCRYCIIFFWLVAQKNVPVRVYIYNKMANHELYNTLSSLTEAFRSGEASLHLTTRIDYSLGRPHYGVSGACNVYIEAVALFRRAWAIYAVSPVYHTYRL